MGSRLRERLEDTDAIPGEHCRAHWRASGAFDLVHRCIEYGALDLIPGVTGLAAAGDPDAREARAGGSHPIGALAEPEGDTFLRDPCEMRDFAVVEANGARIIDINMGCPAKKVTGGLSGSALMKTPDHALSLIEAVVQAVDVPVTLKAGWNRVLLKAAAERAATMAVGEARTKAQGQAMTNKVKAR